MHRTVICSRKLQATKTQEMKFLAMRITWLLEKTVHATIKYFLGFKRMLIQLLREKKRKLPRIIAQNGLIFQNSDRILFFV